jgi:ribosomal protein S18 acetylase RimI-like enzyme
MSPHRIRAIRPAVPADYQAFERLFPELAVEDPMVSQERFDRELLRTALMVEAGDGPDPARIVGYALYQIMKDVFYVRHIVTSPEARRTGVGRALMKAMAERARAAGSTSWCLNVKPLNTAAIALYRGMGMERAFESRALKVTWRIADAVPRVQNTHITARIIAPEDDARIEPTLKLFDGQLALARAMQGRVLIGLFDEGSVLGATVFDPSYPGAYPFRVTRPELAFELLRAVRPHARSSDDVVNMVIEDQPDVADALMAAGATLRLEIVHMKGPLPAPSLVPALSADR